MRLLQLIIFTLVIPGFVIGYVPYALFDHHDTFDLGLLRYAGLLPMALGLIFYVWSALSFLLKGKGTPAIWFTKHLKSLIGEEPMKLVSSGLYTISRNPMYLGVVNVVFGISIFFESQAILIYGIILGVFFHFVIVFLEEPHLRAKYGSEYESYCKRTNRWLGIKSKERIVK